MDSLTHIALGACMGEAFAGKTVGRKAMLWGVLAQSFPDIDFLTAFWTNTTGNLLAHRGFTHSILFCIIITPLLAFFAERWHRPCEKFTFHFYLQYQQENACLLYTSPSPRDGLLSRMPSSA